MRKLLIGALGVLACATAFAADPNTLQQALANPARTAADRERDVRDKPAEVLTFAGVKPGMTVADIFGAGGYYTEILSYAVGPTGKVLIVDNVPYANFSAKEKKERFTEGRLGNVTHRLVEASYLNLPPKSLDLVVIVMSYHDIYWLDEKEGWPAINADGFFESLKAALKPNGRVLIVDHNAAKGSGTAAASKLHRLEEDFTKADFAKHGFVLEKTFDGLRNPKDQLDKMVYDATVKGKTDRYVHLYKLK
jgi:predicted methyltransferase